ncbi:MAG: hypothetical protein ABIG95_00190 [Candidatus Woesearchaeota archaeon]
METEQIVIKEVPQDLRFKLHKTAIEISNLFELSEALEIMSKESYEHHVNDKKNDFATWVREVVKDTDLSSRLRDANTKEKAQKMIRQRIKELETPKGEKKVTTYMDHFTVGFVVGVIFGVLLAIFVL